MCDSGCKHDFCLFTGKLAVGLFKTCNIAWKLISYLVDTMSHVCFVFPELRNDFTTKYKIIITRIHATPPPPKKNPQKHKSCCDKQDFLKLCVCGGVKRETLFYTGRHQRPSQSANERPSPATKWGGVGARDRGRRRGMLDGVEQFSSHAYFTL